MILVTNVTYKLQHKLLDASLSESMQLDYNTKTDFNNDRIAYTIATRLTCFGYYMQFSLKLKDI